MAAGQAALRSNVLDVGAVDVVEARLAEREAARHGAHADALRDALELDGLYGATGLGLCVPSQLALVWRCSETRATSLLLAAWLLAELPGALESLDAAVLTVEQSGQLARVLQPYDQAVREAVWAKVVAVLVADVEQGATRPPARLGEQVRRWAVELDADAVARRRRAERAGDVLLARRDDGLVDVILRGLTAPNAQGCLSRITAASQPFGAADDRPAGKRRLDAAVDLLLGRTGRPAGPCPGPDAGDGSGDSGCAGGSCGCPLGGPVPCGASVTVLVPLATALGVGEVSAELVGHGGLEPDLLAALLGAAPVLRAVWVGPDGTPVSMPDRLERPARGDAEGARLALRRLVAAPPGVRQPRHPDDHDRPGGDGPGDPPPDRAGPRGGADPPGAADTSATERAIAANEHPPDLPDLPDLPTCQTHRTRRTCRGGIGRGYGPVPIHLTPPVLTGSRRGCSVSSACGRRGVNGRAVGCVPPAAIWTTTWPTHTDRRVRATSGRCADATTGSSNSAGSSSAPPTASVGPARPAGRP